MKKIILALAFLVGSIASAAAACTGPAVMHDFPGTSFNMSLSTNAGDGNCSSNMTIVNTLPAYASIPAFKIDQTTPGTTNGVQITGTVPLPSLAATSTKQSDGTQKTQVVDASGNVQPSGDTVARAIFEKVTDGTNTMAVKAASTPPATTDPAAVVGIADGNNVALGAKADAVCGTATGTCSIAALVKFLNQSTSTPLDNSSVKIDTAAAATAQLVAISASTLVRVTSVSVIAGGTGTIKFVYGTGTNCGTGTTDLTGAYPLTAQAGLTLGAGVGTLFKGAAGNALCITTTGAVQMSGHVGFQQF